MRAAEIVGRGVAFCLNNEQGEVLEALTRTILYNHAEDLDEDVPLEAVEEMLITLYDGDVPDIVEDYIDSLDEKWTPITEIEMDL
jgi:hypothetical protein